MTVLSVSVFGPELVSYERSRRIFRTNLRHFSARVFFVKIPQSQYSMIYTISMFFQEQVPKMVSFPMLFGHPTRLPLWPGRPSWITGYQTGSFSSISSFTGCQNGSCSSISRFIGYQNGSFSNISTFPGFQSDSKPIKKITPARP